MSIESVLFLSSTFLPKSDLTKIETDALRIGGYNQPRINLNNGQEVHSSIADFCQGIDSNGVNELIIHYLKSRATLPEGKFCISTPDLDIRNEPWFSKTSYYVFFGDGNSPSGFFIDGSDSLILGFKSNPSPLIRLAALSFCRGLTMARRGSSEDILPQPFPTIVQLQVFRHTGEYSYLNEIASQALRALRWEKLLVDLLVEWAMQQQIPAVYILPSEMNRYINERRSKPDFQDFLQRIQIRYDGTARHCGFKMQPNGLWGLNTANYQLIEYCSLSHFPPASG